MDYKVQKSCLICGNPVDFPFRKYCSEKCSDLSKKINAKLRNIANPEYKKNYQIEYRKKHKKKV
jgi:endogenous inhibitor of DNA gyrase (YacG/DUF329 family)